MGHQTLEHGKTQMGRSHQRLTKKEFVEMLGEVWQIAMTPENVTVFKSTGLFPFDTKQFPESKFNPVDLQMYKKRLEEEMRSCFEIELEQKNLFEANYMIQGDGESVLEFEPQPGPSVSCLNIEMSNDFSRRGVSQPSTQPETSPAPTTSTAAKIPSTGTPKNIEPAITTSALIESSGISIIHIFWRNFERSMKKVSEKSTQTPTKTKPKTRLKTEIYGEVM